LAKAKGSQRVECRNGHYNYLVPGTSRACKCGVKVRLGIKTGKTVAAKVVKKPAKVKKSKSKKSKNESLKVDARVARGTTATLYGGMEVLRALALAVATSDGKQLLRQIVAATKK
jgi:hypothetical protein